MKFSNNDIYILAIGPASGKQTGQRISFEATCNEISPSAIIDIIIPHLFKFNIFYLYFAKYINIWKKLNGKNIIIYITISRSVIGVMRDLILITPFLLNKNIKIAHIHGNEKNFFYRTNNNVFGKIFSWYLSIFENIITLCAKQAEIVQNIVNNGNIHIIENAGFNINLNNKKFTRHNLTCVYNSNLMYSKGIISLLEAAKIAFDNKININFIIFGQPLSDNYMSEKKLMDLMKPYMKLGNVFFVGRVDGDIKDKYLSQSSITILPSFYDSEASPLCLIEGLAYGHFIISSSQGFIGDLLYGAEWSKLLNISSVDIYNALIQYIKSGSCNFSEINQNLYKSRFTTEIYNNKIQLLFQNLNFEKFK